MRKIQSEADLERKKQRSARMMSFFMLVILLFSSVGFAFSYYSSENNPSSQGNTQGAINIGGQDIYLQYSKEEVSSIPVEKTATLADYSGEILYIDSENGGIVQEIAGTLGRYASRVQEACYGKCERDIPEKNCTENLIVWRNSDNERVYQDNKCIFIEGNMKSADAFIYSIFEN